MRHLIFFSCFLIVSACNTKVEPPIDNSQWMSSVYKVDEQLVFKQRNGEEHIYTVQTEQLNRQIYLTSSLDSSSSSPSIIERVDGALNVSYNTPDLLSTPFLGKSPVLIIEPDGSVSQGFKSNGISLHQTNYDEVYVGLIPADQGIFNEIYYKEGIGILAFKREDGQLMVFDRMVR